MSDMEIMQGVENELTKLVTNNDSASNCGSGLLPVFATPALVAFMEQTAHTSIGHLLPEGSTSVGAEINVKHLKATPLGMQVRCHSKLVEADGRRLVFHIEADRFLRNMVRAVVGTLIDIGRGRHDPGWMSTLLESGDRCSAGESVPGHALFLDNVIYPEI